MTDLSELEALHSTATCGEVLCFLMQGWENARGPSITHDDPAGGDPRILGEFARVYSPDALEAVCSIVNALPSLLSTIRSQEAALAEREAVDAAREESLITQAFELRAAEAALVELREERDNAVANMRCVQSAAKTIMIGEADELERLRTEKAGEWVATKTLDSEREANAILTAECDALRAALVEARSALGKANDLIECIQQRSSDNMWWVDATDPEEAVADAHGAVIGALSKLEDGE